MISGVTTLRSTLVGLQGIPLGWIRQFMPSETGSTGGYSVATTAGTGPLMLAQPVDSLPVVADFRWNKLASSSPILAALLWWLVISLFGWLAWPLLYPMLGGVRNRGYGLAPA